MNELIGLCQIVAAIGLLIAPPIVVVRLIAGRKPIDLADLFPAVREPTWPRGIQEEDPPAWHLERLHRRTRIAQAQQGDRSGRRSARARAVCAPESAAT
ncbi:MAG TPA: hypothetical protein VE817_03915 [Candidatus Acidoferrum sp.]|nr:hypothetical protein [Candidatus Acidoferrum sp.]